MLRFGAFCKPPPMRRVWGCLILVLLGGCIVEAPGGERAAAAGRAKAVVKDVPPLNVNNGANLGDKVQIVGAQIVPGRGVPGERVKMTLFFKVLDALETDYQVFVHLDDVDGRGERLNADHPPAGGAYPTSQWKKGETVKDEFTIAIPSGAAGRGYNLFVGLWDRQTDARLLLKNPDAVRSDGNNRVLIAQLPIAQ